MITTDFLCEAEEKPNKSNSNNLRKNKMNIEGGFCYFYLLFSPSPCI